jgi:hypothetical protein
MPPESNDVICITFIFPGGTDPYSGLSSNSSYDYREDNCIATRDLGRIWLKPSSSQGDYWNPRCLGYGPLILPVDYSDLAFDAGQEIYPLFHDGTGDGGYTTTLDAQSGAYVPELDLKRRLDRAEGFAAGHLSGGRSARDVLPPRHARDGTPGHPRWAIAREPRFSGGSGGLLVLAGNGASG